MWCRPVCAILAENILRTVLCIYLEFDKWLKRICLLKVLLSLTVVAFLFSGTDRFGLYPLFGSRDNVRKPYFGQHLIFQSAGVTLEIR